MFRKLISTWLVALLLMSSLTAVSFAEDSSSGDSNDSEDTLTDEVSSHNDSNDTNDSEDSEDELLSEASDDEDSSDSAEVDGSQDDESVTEEIDIESELEDDVLEDVHSVMRTSELKDTQFLSVRWGYFGDKMGQDTSLITADGELTFQGDSAGVPVKLLKWEKKSDSLIFSGVTRDHTGWESFIAGYNDGILFKTRANLASTGENEAKVSFTSNHTDSNIEFSLNDLLTAGEMVFSYGDYQVIFNAWSKDDWVHAVSDKVKQSSESSSSSDVDDASWYAPYLRVAISRGFFEGYKDTHGKLTGKFGPGDSLTRFQLIKVVYELARKLNLGVGATDCDPSTVASTSEVEWMKDHWARGYVQCIYNSGLDVTLLSEVIDGKLMKGIKDAKRWEVIATAFELLDLEVNGTATSELSDLKNGSIRDEFKNMVDTAVELGVINGYPDKTFKPQGFVNRAEMTKIISLFEQVLSI